MSNTRENTVDELFTLTPEQKKAFERMRKAYADCKKLGIVFYNNYGHIGALCKNRFLDDFYNDTDNKNPIYDNGENTDNEFWDSGFVSWADDNHYFHTKGNPT